MAEIEQLSRALRRAHEAGDTQAARRFAAEIKSLRSSTAVTHPEFDPANVPGAKPEFSGAGSFGQGAADTASLGFGDELSAGLITGIERLRGNDQSYSDVLGDLRGMRTEAQEQNPKSFMGGQFTGGVAQGVATGGAGFLPNATSLGAKMLGGAGTGATYGGIYGFGSGEDSAYDRLIEALKTGGLGAAVGGAFPVLAAGASKGYQGIMNALSGKQAAQKAGATPEALRMLSSTLDADGTRGPRGQANMALAGDDAMLADAGPNAKAILDTAIQRGGPGTIAARDAIEGRVSRGGEALVKSLDDTLGAPQGVNAAQRTIRNAARPAVNEAYERAYSTPIDYASSAGQKVEGIINRIPNRIAGRAVREAMDEMVYDGVPNAQMMAQIADDGKVTFQSMPNVMQADYIKRALNNIVEDGTDDLTGKMSSEAAFASRMARDLRDALGEAVPAYRDALETAADPLSRQSAIRLGSKLLSPSMTRDQVEEAVKGMTGPERQALSQGVRSQIDDAMARVTRTVQDGNTDAREAVKALKDMSSRANREKLASAIGKEKAEGLFNELDRIATSFDLKASVAENSKTYARQAVDRRIGEVTAPGPVGELAQGKPVPAFQRGVQMLTGQTPEKVAGKQDAMYSELAKLLTRPAGQAQTLFDTIDTLGRTDQSTGLMADRLARALSGPRLSYPSTALIDNYLGQ